MSEKSIILIGGGGHCASCIDVIKAQGQYEVAGIVDDPKLLGQKLLGVDFIGTDNDLPGLIEKYRHVLITVGQIKSAQTRKSIYEKCKSLGASFPTIISPLAYVSDSATIGEGTIVHHHALVNANAKIGHQCIINSKALVEHDVVMGNFCHLSTGAIANGHCRIGDECFIGSNATIKHDIAIPDNSLVSFGQRVDSNRREGARV